MGRFYAPPPTSYSRLDVERDSTDKSAMTIKQRGAWPSVALKLEGALIGEMSVATDTTTATALTLPVGKFIEAILERDGHNNRVTDITPTAAQIVAAIPDCTVGHRFTFHYVNLDASNGGGIICGTGVVGVGGRAVTFNVAGNKMRSFLCVVTNASSGSEEVTIYPLGDATTHSS
tara:strand:- start:197 stop:721 length:525 start_codon:yes stop_codon:yes gene_type:complete